MMALQLDRAAQGHVGCRRRGRAAARSGDKVGVVGFCMGGGLALVLATQRPDAVAACVSFYGLIPWPDAQPDYSKMSGAVSRPRRRATTSTSPPKRPLPSKQQLKGLGKDVEFHVYAGADHAFFNDTRPEVYDAAASALAWERTIDFLHARLG